MIVSTAERTMAERMIEYSPPRGARRNLELAAWKPEVDQAG